MLYKIRYGILDSNIIANVQGPEWASLNSFREKYEGILDWDQRSINAREILAQEHIKLYDSKYNGFYQKLEESILKEGFRNPILIIVGKRHSAFHSKEKNRSFDERVPLYMVEDHSKIIACVTGGCSRLYLAQKHNLEIPVIVSDFVDKFEDFEQLFTVEDIRSKYKDQPSHFVMGNDGLVQRSPNHIHMSK